MAEENGRDGTVTLTVDGVEVTVPEGTRVIEAAERVGVVVPHYCYHPGIPTRPAQCRVCLVEVEGQGKLQPSCVLQAQDGMVVHTDSERAELARKSVIEFLLLNHPLDCPICDAAGQCMLQDYAFETGQLESRLDEEKLVMGRDKISDDILYFADRCIICTRCVRFMREVAEDDALVVANRGHKAYIDTAPGEKLDNPFQGNIVDVCPVGALVHEDFVFKPRYWDMDSTPSVCPGCSTGCNVTVDTKENQIVRLKPRHNADVNSYWMCDYGRHRYEWMNRRDRIEIPLLSAIPIIGQGLYVDQHAGAASATGTGELITGVCASFLVVEEMRRGASPQDAIGACTPRPRKDRPAAASTAVDTPSVPTTISVGITFGSRCRKISLAWPAPAAMAASK